MTNIRINAASGLVPTQPNSTASKSGSNGFALSSAAETRQSAGLVAPQTASAVIGLDALITLQAEASDPLSEKRRRQIKRANGLLDSLEKLKLELLDGHLTEGAVTQLKSKLQSSREAIEDPGLADLLDHIETRARVALAKRGYEL